MPIYSIFMSKGLNLSIIRILIVAMLLMPMQHIFAHSPAPSMHNMPNSTSAPHHGHTGMLKHSSDSSNSCDSSSISTDCKTDHSNACGGNCSSMGHCCMALVSTLNFSPTRVFENTVNLSHILTDITPPVETHPPQTL